MVPPDDLEPVLRHLMNTFVTDRRADEVIAIGLNTIREICLRSPWAFDGHPEMVKDLVMYKKHKNKVSSYFFNRSSIHKLRVS